MNEVIFQESGTPECQFMQRIHATISLNRVLNFYEDARTVQHKVYQRDVLFEWLKNVLKLHDEVAILRFECQA